MLRSLIQGCIWFRRIDTDWSHYPRPTDSGIFHDVFTSRIGRSPTAQEVSQFRQQIIQLLTAASSQSPLVPVAGADRLLSRLAQGGSHRYITRFGGWLAAMKAFIDYASKDLSSITDVVARRVVSRGPRDPSLRLRFRVLLRDNFRCRQCGRSPATHIGVSLHVDHVSAWEQGGPTKYENLQTLCADCNLGKSNLSLESPCR
jgi:hypothetical protein